MFNVVIQCLKRPSESFNVFVVAWHMEVFLLHFIGIGRMHGDNEPNNVDVIQWMEKGERAKKEVLDNEPFLRGFA